MRWYQEVGVQFAFYGLDEGDVEGTAATDGARLLQLKLFDQ
jgi:hypothetical protein